MSNPKIIRDKYVIDNKTTKIKENQEYLLLPIFSQLVNLRS